MAFAVVLASGKGGVGKTTLTALLARALDGMGARVAVVDADFGLRNLDIALGAEHSVVYDMADVVHGRCELTTALVRIAGNLHLLAAPYEGDVAADAMRSVVDSLKTAFDIVLIDAPAGIGDGFRRAVGCVDHAIVVTTPDGTSIRDVERVTALLRAGGHTDVRLCVNRLNRRHIDLGLAPNVDDIIDAVSARLIGIIPEDERLALVMAAGGDLLRRRWQVARAVRDMAARIAYKS